MSTKKSIINNDSLKEYYVNLQELYVKAVNMLTAINASLSTSASEITIDIADDNGVASPVRIPSFLYLESKLEQIENNFNNLFKMPKSGEAWFAKSSDMYKLNMVRSNTAPITPSYESTDIFASVTDNNILKDLVSPKTFLKLNLIDVPSNVDKMYMKKFVINSSELFDTLKSMSLRSYDDYVAALYNYTKGKDYDVYDSIISTPLRRDIYKSRFEIDDILNDGNPWTDETTGRLNYKVRFNTMTYYDQEDSSITFGLKAGDLVALGNEMAVYKIKNVDNGSHTVTLEEVVGHFALQTTFENSSMVFSIYNDNYNEYSHVQIPLEENRYVCIFIGTIYNNIRSILSTPLLLDLTTIYMKDASGNYMLDEYGNRMSYIKYYNEYCMNIGDLILGLTQAAYPQLSNYNANQLNDLQNSKDMDKLLLGTFNKEGLLKVLPINKHLTNDQASEEIKKLHAQKNDINAQITTVQSNINQVYNQLTTTDFSQETSVTQSSLQSQLRQYYTDRTTLEKQLNAVIDAINSKTAEIKTLNTKIKYRVRGITDISELEAYVKSVGDSKCAIVAMDVEYKYKSTTKDTSTVNIINSSTFTDWNKLNNIERQRKLVFDDILSNYRLEFVDYSSTDNVIKWNQIDIPISSGEDVVIRVRYKLNIGQPFVDIFTPWSEEFTIPFPTEFEEDVEVKSIVETNESDSITAGYRKILIDDGYEEHIQNKSVTSDRIFYHQPENIYSGFNTAENNLISLKDKLIEMVNDIETYKKMIDSSVNAKFTVHLEFDGQSVPLSPGVVNKINVYNSDHISGTFVRKDMNLVIKNTGDCRVNLYSIFPGNTQIPLIQTDIDYYNSKIVNYERVPMMVNNEIGLQRLGQWIYFRQTNPYTNQSIYYDTSSQRIDDMNSAMGLGDENTEDTVKSTKFNGTVSNYLNVTNKQVLLAYRERNTQLSMQKYKQMSDAFAAVQSLISLYHPYEPIYTPTWKDEVEAQTEKLNDLIAELPKFVGVSTDTYNELPAEFFIYKNSPYSNDDTSEVLNNYLLRYEDIQGTNSMMQKVTLDKATPILNFMNEYSPKSFKYLSDFSGAFFFPDLMNYSQVLTKGGENDSVYIDVGAALTLPVTFEYFVDGTEHKTATKSIYFDIKNSLVSNPIHYMIELTGNYDYSSSGDIYNSMNNQMLADSITNSTL